MYSVTLSLLYSYYTSTKWCYWPSNIAPISSVVAEGETFLIHQVQQVKLLITNCKISLFCSDETLCFNHSGDLMGVYRLKHVNKWCECWRQCYIRWSADRLGRQEPSVTHLKSVTVARSEPSCLLYSYAPQWAVLSVLTCSDSAGYPPLRLSVYLGLLLYSLSCKMKVSREVKQMTAHDQGQWPCSLLSTLAGTKTLSRTQSSNMWTLDTHMCENTPVTLSTGLCSSAG